MKLTGSNLVAGAERSGGTETYRSVDPVTGEAFGPDFHDATDQELDDTVDAAAGAFAAFRHADGCVIARLLEGIADRLEALGDDLVDTASRETGLGTQRITGECGRTCGQLRAFARVAATGSALGVRIDLADPDATPPKPDLRRIKVPIGPVAVFGASNFPLAFSVPGGDTASALAAGCPVVVKVHPSHPATSELCGRAIAEAVADAGLPAGVFSLLHGRAVAVSQRLVLAPGIQAVGFTGSETAGRALYDLGAGREQPIPVYAEMGSLNPQFVTDRALEQRGAEIAEGLVGSMTMGTGQFCTKPGLVFVPDSPAGRDFEKQVAALAAEVGPGPLLNESVCTGLNDRLERSTQLEDVDVLVAGGAGESGFQVGPTVMAADYAVFVDSPELAAEHFGPVTILVRTGSLDDMVAVTRQLPGALAASVHGTDEDADDVRALMAELRELAGRVIWNQFPTGVAVTPAMHHGGPYPATTFPAHTSVGTAAIDRFLRPVSYQNTPQALLPARLQDANPDGLMRMVNGSLTDRSID